MMRFNTYRLILDKLIQIYRIRSREELLAKEDTRLLHKLIVQADKKLTELGFMEMTIQEYENWLAQIETEKKKRSKNQYFFRSHEVRD